MYYLYNRNVIFAFCISSRTTVDEGIRGLNVQLQLVPMLCLIAGQKPISCSYHCAQQLGFYDIVNMYYLLYYHGTFYCSA